MTPDAPKRDAAPTWLLFLLVICAIGAVGYFAFYDTGREADATKAPVAVSRTQAKTVETAATPPPSPVASTPPPLNAPR